MSPIKVNRFNTSRDISAIALIVDGKTVRLIDLNVLTSMEYWYHAGIKSYVVCFHGLRIDRHFAEVVTGLIDKDVQLKFDIKNEDTKDSFIMSGVSLWAACLGKIRPDDAIKQALIFKCGKHERLESLLSSQEDR